MITDFDDFCTWMYMIAAILNMTRFFGSSPKKVLNYRPMWEISGRNRANFKIPSRNNRHIENC